MADARPLRSISPMAASLHSRRPCFRPMAISLRPIPADSSTRSHSCSAAPSPAQPSFRCRKWIDAAVIPLPARGEGWGEGGDLFPGRARQPAAIAQYAAAGKNGGDELAAARAVFQRMNDDGDLVAGLHRIGLPTDARLLRGSAHLERPLQRLTARLIL